MITKQERERIKQFDEDCQGLMEGLLGDISRDAYADFQKETKTLEAGDDRGFFAYEGWDTDDVNKIPEAAKSNSYNVPGEADAEQGVKHTEQDVSQTGAMRAEDYKFDRPDMPAGMTWDDNLEQWFRASMAEQGKSQDEAAAMYDAYNKGQIQTYLESDEYANYDPDAETETKSEEQETESGSFFDYDDMADEAPVSQSETTGQEQETESDYLGA